MPVNCGTVAVFIATASLLLEVCQDFCENVQLRSGSAQELCLSSIWSSHSQWLPREARRKFSYQKLMSAPVPAWKRLGLKLKYAQDNSDPTSTSGNGDGQTNEIQERPAKRQRVNLEDTSNGTPITNGTQKRSKEPKTKVQSKSQATDLPVHLLKRKKSVTFTNDTKDEDGDSRTTIDFPAGSPGSTPKKRAKPDHPDEAANPSIKSNVAANKVKKKSSVERKAARKALKDKSEPSLVYLAQHRGDRSSWKFNKNRDVWILSNALKAESIPSDHLLALAGYVRGLPRNAGARTRLVKECQDALKESEAIDGPAKLSFMEAVDSSNAMTIPDSAYASIPRAQLLLWALDEEILSPQKSTPTPAKKARKSRTAAPVDISSSESETDSDSDSDSESVQVKKSKSHTAQKDGTKDNTSSSGSSTAESSDGDYSSSDSSSSTTDSD